MNSEISQSILSLPVTVELCAGSVDDVELAAEYGVDRIELNSGIAVGGLTPSMGLVRECCRMFHGPVIAMVRPREGGFCYSELQYRQMLLDARLLLEQGIDGIAAGFLKADGRIDQTRCSDFRTQLPGCCLVFHRAFDVLPCRMTGLAELIESGWNRILTSGGQRTAMEGCSSLAELHAAASGRIEILPGGGVRPHNVGAIVTATGIRSVHTALGIRHEDPSTRHNPELSFGPITDSESGMYSGVSRELLAAMMDVVRKGNIKGKTDETHDRHPS